MGQIIGSGVGNFHNTAVVDNSINSQQGRLLVQSPDGLSISKGDVTNTSFIHKFGQAPDFDTGDLDVTVWDGANAGGINAMNYTYSTLADIDSVVSSNATDVQSIEIQGLDSNYAQLTQTATLNGSLHVGLGSSFLRVFRMKNTGSSNFAGQIYTYVSGPVTAGVPTATSVRANVNDGNNQTLMAIYTIPSGCTGYMRDWYASTAGANKTTNYLMDLLARPISGVFQLKHRSAIGDIGTSNIQHNYTEPEVFNEKTDLEMRAKITETTITAASVSAGFDIVLVNK